MNPIRRLRLADALIEEIRRKIINKEGRTRGDTDLDLIFQ
jgi:hypothetical protein